MDQILRAGLHHSARVLLVLFFVTAADRISIASELSQAEITQIIKEAQLIPEQGAPRPAVVKDLVKGGTALRTGPDSRTELTFTDRTLARIGANTLFSFNAGTRTVDLGSGVMLLYLPKGAGGAKISTAAVTAAITGTTVLVEYHPGESAPAQDSSARSEEPPGATLGLVRPKPKPRHISSSPIKFITLEGTAHVFLNGRPGEPILVYPGKMLIVTPDGQYEIRTVNLAVLMNTCSLITDFSPLDSEPLIADEIQHQRDQAIEGTLIDTNLVDYGGGLPVTLKDPNPLDTLDQRKSASALVADDIHRRPILPSNRTAGWLLSSCASSMADRPVSSVASTSSSDRTASSETTGVSVRWRASQVSLPVAGNPDIRVTLHRYFSCGV